RGAAQLRHIGFFKVEIAEMNRACRTGRLTGGNHLAVRDWTIFLFGGPGGAADALEAIIALLHDAAAARRDVGIVLRLQCRAFTGVGLTIGIGEIIEAPYLVRAIGLAKARADAAVIRLDVQAFMIVHGCLYCAHRLAWRQFAMHARHRLEAATRHGLLGEHVAIDPQPVHVATLQNLIPPNDRNVVFRLTSDNAGIATDARIAINHHGPSALATGRYRKEAGRV